MSEYAARLPVSNAGPATTRGLVAAIVLLLLAQVFALLVRAWLQLQLEDTGLGAWPARNLSYPVVPLLLAPLLLPLWRRYGRDVAEVLRPSGLSVRLVLAGVAFGIALRLAWWGLLLARVAFGELNADAPVTGPRLSFGCPPVVTMLLHVIVMAALVPIVEEIVNRAWLARWLLRFGTAPAAAGSAALFALLHTPQGLLTAFGFGLIAALLFFRSGTLWAVLIGHATFNALIVIDWHCLNTVWNPQERTGGVVAVGILGLALAAAALLATWRLLPARAAGPQPGGRLRPGS